MLLTAIKMQFSEIFNDIVLYAREEAMRTGHMAICPDHLMLGILRHADNGACSVLDELGIDSADLKRYLESGISLERIIPYSEQDNVNMTRNSQNAVNMAMLEASMAGRDSVEAEDLMLGVVKVPQSLSRTYFESRAVNYQILRQHVAKDAAKSEEKEANPVIPGIIHTFVVNKKTFS